MRTSLTSMLVAIAIVGAGCGGQQAAAPSAGTSAPAAAAPQAASRPAVNAPSLNDGDDFAIRLAPDTASGLQLPADLDLIVKHDGDSLVFASKQTPQLDAGAMTLVLDAQMCATQFQDNNITTRFQPCDQSAQFPLQVGKTWTARYGQSTAGGEFIQQTGSGTVMGIEQVTVPAGTFQAYRIDARHGPDIRTTSWYVPEVGFFVKVQSSSPQQLNFELVSYHRGGSSH
ncbi:MAG TPA: hypothetical protein VMA09_16935 [Candidatus Binataceae bacterium]|nr:hypothetical protein [Candidatus Binataceae bacterium]